MRHAPDGTLNAWLDGALVGEEAEQLREHLATCVNCRGRLQEAERIRDEADALLAGGVPAAVAPPPFAEILARARQAGTPDRGRPHPAGPRPAQWRALAWAATIALALAGGWWARGAFLRPASIAMSESPAPPSAREAATAALPPQASAPRPAPQQATAPRSPALESERTAPSGEQPVTAARAAKPGAAAPVAAEPVAAAELATNAAQPSAAPPERLATAARARVAGGGAPPAARQEEGEISSAGFAETREATPVAASFAVAGLPVLTSGPAGADELARLTQRLPSGDTLRVVVRRTGPEGAADAVFTGLGNRVDQDATKVPAVPEEQKGQPAAARQAAPTAVTAGAADAAGTRRASNVFVSGIYRGLVVTLQAPLPVDSLQALLHRVPALQGLYRPPR